MLQFPQELERNIYIDAIAGRYGIASEELKRMVNSFGASMSREQVEEAIYQQQEQEEMPVKRAEKENNVLTAQKLFLTWLIEDPSLYMIKSKIILMRMILKIRFIAKAATLVF